MIRYVEWEEALESVRAVVPPRMQPCIQSRADLDPDRLARHFVNAGFKDTTPWPRWSVWNEWDFSGHPPDQELLRNLLLGVDLSDTRDVFVLVEPPDHIPDVVFVAPLGELFDVVETFDDVQGYPFFTNNERLLWSPEGEWLVVLHHEAVVFKYQRGVVLTAEQREY